MKGIHWFSLYNISVLLGAFAVALRSQIPDFFSIVMGDLLVIIGYLFLYLSLAELYGRKSWYFFVQVGLVLVGIAAMLQFGSFYPNTRNRLVAYSLILACQQAQIALFLRRKEDASSRSISGWMTLVLTALSTTNLIRVVGVLYLGAPKDYLRAGTFLEWILIVASSLQCAIMVAYVWMTAALLRHNLEVQASTDPLTGLLNRRALELAAERELASHQEPNSQICAIIIDLDGFKQINDSYGHHCGDATLVAVAQSLRDGVRKGDHLGRLGGDEFAILLPDITLAKAMEIAERLRSSIEALEIVHGEIRVKVTGSFGLAGTKDIRSNWDQLTMRCDQALYLVKRSGGNLTLTQN